MRLSMPSAPTVGNLSAADTSDISGRGTLTRFAWLSIATAIITIGLKLAAYWMTGSVGLLSDALESFVNLAGAIIGLVALTFAARAPDEERPFGYDKAEYFASGAEGGLILSAAAVIAWTAIERMLNPQPVELAERGYRGLGTGLDLQFRHGTGPHAGRPQISVDHARSRRPASDDRCLDFRRACCSRSVRFISPAGNGWIR